MIIIKSDTLVNYLFTLQFLLKQLKQYFLLQVGVISFLNFTWKRFSSLLCLKCHSHSLLDIPLILPCPFLLRTWITPGVLLPIEL